MHQPNEEQFQRTAAAISSAMKGVNLRQAEEELRDGLAKSLNTLIPIKTKRKKKYFYDL